MIKSCHTPDEFAYMKGIMQTIEAGGTVVEVGVWNGGTAKAIKDEFPNRTIHLFDTFRGILPEHAEGDWKGGDYSAHFPDVQRTLGDDYFYHMGDVCKTKELVSGERFVFVHIDLDVYKPLAEVLPFFYDRLSVGGVMMVSNHDLAHPGVQKAVKEFGLGKQYSRYVIYKNHGTS